MRSFRQLSSRPGGQASGLPKAALWLAGALLLCFGFATVAPAQNSGGAFAPQQKTKKKAAKKPAPKPASKAKTPARTEPTNPDQLPPGYEPPGEIPAVMKIEKPVPKEELDKLEKELGVRLSDYRRALRSKTLPGEKEKEIIRKGIRYRLGVMTLPENRDKLAELREDLTLRDLPQAGSLLDKPKDVREMRSFVLKEVVNEAKKLLDNNFYVRLNATILMSELELTQADSKRGIPLEAYTPAAEPLLEVIKDPQQHPAVKIAAVQGLVRILRIGTPDVELRTRIAEALVAELKDPNQYYWYQMRLAEGLSAVDKVMDLNQKPFVIQALATAMADPQRHWLVRAEAAKSLGRVPMDPSINVKLLAHQIVQLGSEMAKAYEQQPKPKDVYWKSAFFKLYLAFQALDEKDKDAERKNKGGLLNHAYARQQPAVREAYDRVLPLVRSVLMDKPIPPDQQQSVSNWLEQNKPNDYRVNPNVEPISIQRAPTLIPTTADRR